jgi:polyphosphate kinase
MPTSLRDTAKCWELLPDGSYKRRVPTSGEKPLNSQEYLKTDGGAWREE